MPLYSPRLANAVHCNVCHGVVCEWVFVGTNMNSWRSSGDKSVRTQNKTRKEICMCVCVHCACSNWNATKRNRQTAKVHASRMIRHSDEYEMHRPARWRVRIDAGQIYANCSISKWNSFFSALSLSCPSFTHVPSVTFNHCNPASISAVCTVACHGQDSNSLHVTACYQLIVFWHRIFYLIQTDTFRISRTQNGVATPLTMPINFHLNIYLFAENDTSTFFPPRQSLQRYDDECDRNLNWQTLNFIIAALLSLPCPHQKIEIVNC